MYIINRPKLFKICQPKTYKTGNEQNLSKKNCRLSDPLGKSKIIHEIEKPEIILENPLNQKVFEEENYDNIIHNLASLGLNPKKKMYVFLDEVQLVPNIVKAVKYLYDSYQIKFFLTGSSSFYLKNLFPESLVG